MASGNNRARRLQETRWMRAKAPLAAQFEDCLQASERLSDSLQANRPNSSDLRELARLCTNNLRRWGHESGASSRALDYALKCSPGPTKQTHALLADLFSVLEAALALVRPRFPDPDTVNPGDSADPGDDEDVDLGPETCLKEVFDIIDCLWSLLPILRAPLDEDDDLHDDGRDMDAYSAGRFVQNTLDLFPRASVGLAGRLGKNIWRRRKHLLHLRRRSQLHAAPGAMGAFAHGNPSQRRTGAPSLAQMRRARTIASSGQSSRVGAEASHSDGGTSVSGGETQITSFIVSTAPYSDQTFATSSSHVGDRPPAILERLVLPEPPDGLDKELYCQYCHFELPLTVSATGITRDEWIDHVYLDLKPYMCTYEDCTWGDTMFGTRQEWFRHELDCHRTKNIWSCGRRPFGTEKAFIEHIADSHPRFGIESLPLIADACKRYPAEPPCLDCELCGQTCGSLELLGDHVSEHLELLALMSLLDLDLVGFNDASSDGFDNIREFLDQIHEADKEPVAGAKTLRAGSPGQHSTGEPTIGDANNARSTQQNINGLDKEMKRQKITQAAEERVRTFLDNQGGPSLTRPVRCNIPDRNSTFLGRRETLGEIHDFFSTSGRICIIWGCGGIGKSATAIEYLHRHRDEYPYILWVDAENPGKRHEKYTMIASALEESGGPRPEAKGTAAVRDCLADLEQRWLLIFDNVKKWSDISRYVPNRLGTSRGSVLITSQLPSDQLGIPSWRIQKGLELPRWSLNNGRAFLLTSLSSRLSLDNLQAHDEYEYAEKVVNVVERLPLALSMLVGFLKVAKCTLGEFLEIWEERDSSRRLRKRLPTNLETPVDDAIDSLWEIGIREVRADCRQLLDVMSFFGPDDIPKSLLVGDHEEEYLTFLHRDERQRYKRMIEQLQRQRYISTRPVGEEEFYDVHRILRLKIQLHMDDYGFDTSFRKAFRLIRKAFPQTDKTQVPLPKEMEICKRYMPHLDSFFWIFKGRADECGTLAASGSRGRALDVAKLFYDAGFYVYGSQRTAYDGFPFVEMAERILDDIKEPPDNKIRADIHCVTGLLHLYTDGPARTKGTERLRKTWEIRRRIYIEDSTQDNDVLSQNAANDYSVCLMNMYQFDEVDEIIRGCFKRYQIWGPESENPFEYSKYYGNYSAVLLWQGKVEEAIWHVERSLDLTQKFSGRGTHYYRRMFWLACILLQAGDVQASFEKHMEVLNARLELHGKHHENTILSLYAVAATYHHLGDLSSAIDHMQMCIKSALSSRWSTESLGRAQYHLATLYEEVGETKNAAEAKSLREKGEKVLEEFKPNSPAAIRESGDNMMIFDDMQSTFWGRYTGRKLLKFMQERMKAEREQHA